ncbi:tRNA pseudouridine synthase 1 [Cadophora gregata f. sp. sojae]|nr:tRNA pseudouridine synthase 1 [Cadophora gregata f. sp. sojae]
MADSSSAVVPACGSAYNGNENDISQNANPGDRQRKQRGRGRGRGGQGRGGRGGGRGGSRDQRGFTSKDQGGRNKKGEVGRGEWTRGNIDKRKRNDEDQAAKRRKINKGQEVAEGADLPFSREEIDAEGRKPKRKVAVMIGYAGSGYKGMQINGAEKTIEGDIFKAFVAAGAISKANADDPKKSSLVRCARTDKGVHAAGNVISLKLIVEESNIIQLINENLPPQIRVWGIERTNGSFSCYQTCDSRWYEYLIPTYSFLPPHPQSFLGKKLVESAEKEGVFEIYQSRQEDVIDFWESTEETYVKPILDKLDPELREAVLSTLHSSEDPTTGKTTSKPTDNEDQLVPEMIQGVEEVGNRNLESQKAGKTSAKLEVGERDTSLLREDINKEYAQNIENPAEPSKSVLSPLEATIKEIKAAYITAKKAYRISASRRERVQQALSSYVGTRNFHNYTIQKTFSDPSAKRVIRSFKVGPDPIIINDTEWLSLKVHGQSFMMHQIRKMVAMAALVVRCGSSLSIINDSYGAANISIPKAPGLGLLLERPVFDSYNQKAVNEYKREKINFDNYQKEMDEFKQREIYDRIFREEERDHQFHAFFHHVDHFRTDFFLWVTASGLSAAKQSTAPARTDNNSDDEADVNGEEG